MNPESVVLRGRELSGDVAGVLDRYPRAVSVDLSGNHLYALGRPSPAPQLQALRLAGNALFDEEEFFANIGRLSALRELDVRENPLTFFYFAETAAAGAAAEDIEAYDRRCAAAGLRLGAKGAARRRHYRTTLLKALPRLRVLDGITVSASERAASGASSASASASASVLPQVEDLFDDVNSDPILEGLPLPSLASSPSPALLPSEFLPSIGDFGLGPAEPFVPEAASAFPRAQQSSAELGSATFFEDISRRLDQLGAELSTPVQRPLCAPESSAGADLFDRTALDPLPAEDGFEEDSSPSPSPPPLRMSPSLQQPSPSSLSALDVELAVQRALQPVVSRLTALERLAESNSGSFEFRPTPASRSIRDTGTAPAPSPTAPTPLQRQPQMLQTPPPPRSPQKAPPAAIPPSPVAAIPGAELLRERPSGIAFTLPIDAELRSPRKEAPRRSSRATPSTPKSPLGLTLLLPKCYNQRQRDEYEAICQNLVEHLLAVPSSQADLPRRVLAQNDVEFLACSRLVRIQSCAHFRYECTKVTRLYRRQELWNLLRMDGGRNAAGTNVRMLFNAATSETIAALLEAPPSLSSYIGEDEPLLLGSTLAVSDATTAEDGSGSVVRRVLLRMVKIGSWELFEGSPGDFEASHEAIFAQLRSRGSDGIVLSGPPEDMHLRQFFYSLQPRRCAAAYCIEYRVVCL